VANVAGLMRFSGLVPRTLDLAPLLEEARRQLHEEADYRREGENLRRFGALLQDQTDFCVPAMHDDLSNADVLAMDFIESVAVETLESAPQEDRDRVASLLIDLTLQELFDFHLMQTDPNFANYRFCPTTGQIVLLDFGATRPFPATLVSDFRALMNAGLAADAEAARHLAKSIGFFDDKVAPHHQEAILEMMETVFAAIRKGGPFDFAQTDLTRRLRDMGMDIGAERDLWHVPPVDTLFLNRKFGGIYLLATRLRARVNLMSLLAAYR
jgi:predicted unusual protein kinase regulating ubiquinone biosynthesis (AarF/ABC1/UbiB family)